MLHDRAETYKAEEAMVRTQVYLTRAEHDFLLREAERRREGMSAVLRGIIDQRMNVPEEEPGAEGLEDGSLNHDHYAYGAPKKYKKVRGKWVMKAEDEE